MFGNCYNVVSKTLEWRYLRENPQKSTNPAISLVENNVISLLIGPLKSPNLISSVCRFIVIAKKQEIFVFENMSNFNLLKFYGSI